MIQEPDGSYTITLTDDPEGKGTISVKPAQKPLSNDLIWTYAHLNKIKGNVVEFVRKIEEHHGIK